MHRGGTYICIEGPQFSTKAESRIYRGWGVDVIGMTNMPEAKLAREAELCYATLALVTDYDVWHEGHDAVTVEAVIQTLLAQRRHRQGRPPPPDPHGGGPPHVRVPRPAAQRRHHATRRVPAWQPDGASICFYRKYFPLSTKPARRQAAHEQSEKRARYNSPAVAPRVADHADVSTSSASATRWSTC